MQFPTLTSPHSERPNSVAQSMLWVIIALVPGIAAMTWYFGWGTLINITLATLTALLCESIAVKLRGRPALPVLGDLSAIVTALLFAIAVPPLLPWWLTVIGVAFAILMVKQIYGGLGYNPFNPAMAAYVLLLVSYPVEMTSWLPPDVADLNKNPLSFYQTFTLIFSGQLPPGLTWDALTMATPLDTMRTQLDMNHQLSEIGQGSLWGDFGGKGWEWIGNWYLLGGIILLYKRIISWHIPVAMMGALILISMFFHMLDQDVYPFALFHLFSGGTILGAFFIATDPVSACTTKKGQLVYGACIGLLIYIIRTWGGYPDAVAFAVLLLNMAAPTIDHFTQPRAYGHQDPNND